MVGVGEHIDRLHRLHAIEAVHEGQVAGLGGGVATYIVTLLKTGDLIESDFKTVRIDATLGELVAVVADSKRNIFPVLDSRSHFQGFVSLEDIRREMFKTEQYNTTHVYNYMKSAPAYVYIDEKMDSVMKKFEQTEAWNLPVVEADRTYVGFVSKSKIFSAYRDQLKQVSHD